ncbi:MAG: hypothetical protein ACC657_18380 [Thiohalomonadales bacterium]
MTNISLDISGKIDPRIVELFGLVGNVLAELKMPYIVVGATARDLVLHLLMEARGNRSAKIAL